MTGYQHSPLKSCVRCAASIKESMFRAMVATGFTMDRGTPGLNKNLKPAGLMLLLCFLSIFMQQLPSFLYA